MLNYYKQKQVTRAKAFAKKHVFPDTCKVKGVTAVTVNEYGIPSKTTVYRTYEGNENIPCRFDIIRSVRFSHAKTIPVITTEHIVNFPVDFVFDETDIIEAGNVKYQIMKKHALNIWDVTIVCNIIDLQTKESI